MASSLYLIASLIPEQHSVTSKLDYCNSILYGSPNTILNKLHYVQNSADHMLTASRRCDHITPLLRDLHWLPVKFRIHLKILLTTPINSKIT
jgi:hypothetical protein